MMNFGNMGWGTGYWWMGGLLMMFFFGWLLYILLRRNPNDNRFRVETVYDILAKRYARGEINKEEYDRMLSDL